VLAGQVSTPWAPATPDTRGAVALDQFFHFYRHPSRVSTRTDRDRGRHRIRAAATPRERAACAHQTGRTASRRPGLVGQTRAPGRRSPGEETGASARPWTTGRGSEVETRWRRGPRRPLAGSRAGLRRPATGSRRPGAGLRRPAVGFRHHRAANLADRLPRQSAPRPRSTAGFWPATKFRCADTTAAHHQSDHDTTGGAHGSASTRLSHTSRFT
jgi:hypothetical protein